MIFTEAYKEPEFDPNIDINSLLPVYYLPIFKKEVDKEKQITGILEIVLKNRIKNIEEGYEPIEILAEKFGECVQTVYNILQF